MVRRHKPYSEEIRRLLDEASLALHSAEIEAARRDRDASAEARRLYLQAALAEEEAARLLTAWGDDPGARISLVSAAHCYEQAEQYADALRVCRRALRHPALPERMRPSLEQLERRCLAELQPPSLPAPKPEPAEAVSVV
jgi:tetratricopeptide (TPR) repeat protein